MNDIALKTKAYTLAESTPRYLDKPTSPPLIWYQEGDQIVIILADGRKVHAPVTIDKPKSMPAPIPAKAVNKTPLPSIPVKKIEPVSHHKKS